MPWFQAAVAALAIVALGVTCGGTVTVANAQSDRLIAEGERMAKLHNSGKHSEVVEMGPPLLGKFRDRFGQISPLYASALRIVMSSSEQLKRYKEAEEFCKEAIAIYEKLYGPQHPSVGMTLTTLGKIYRWAGRYPESEASFKRAVAIYEAAEGAQSPSVATTLTNLALPLIETGRYIEAEAVLKRSLVMGEQLFGKESNELLYSLNNLVHVYYVQGRYIEAEPLSARALAITEKLEKAAARRTSNERKNNAIDVSETLTARGRIMTSLARYVEAERLLKRSISIFGEAYGTSGDGVAGHLAILADLYLAQSRFAEAEPLYRQALSGMQASGLSQNELVVTIQNHLGLVNYGLNRFTEAEAAYKEALATGQAVLGDNHPEVGAILRNLAMLKLDTGDLALARDFSRRSADIAIRALSEGDGSLLEFKLLRPSFETALTALDRAKEAKLVNQGGAEEAFGFAQWSIQSAAAAALSQMSTRVGAGNDTLAALVREHQDAGTERRSLEKMIAAEVGKPSAQRSSEREHTLRQRLSLVEQSLGALSQRLSRDFQNYTALTNPKPLQVKEAQAVLGSDEALVFIFAGEKQSHIFAATRESFQWQPISLSKDDLATAVNSLRQGIELDDAKRLTGTNLFDLQVAYDLYRWTYPVSVDS